MLFFFFFVCSIPSLTAYSKQEDLAVSTYSSKGCLRLKPDKAFPREQLEENFLLPYQTYVSPQMSIELCFRLCRRWMVLMFDNRTHCLCLYTLPRPDDLSNFLGELITDDRCTALDGQIFTLTKDSSLLPPLSDEFDWTFDGCYYIQGTDQARASLWINQGTFLQAMDVCRKYCQVKLENNYSFFISRRRGCYCLPMKLNSVVARLQVVRKPLSHCSFLPYLCLNSSDACQSIISNIHIDTMIRVDVKRHCLATSSLTFIFDQRLLSCLQTIPLSTSMTYARIIDAYSCLPLTIRTIDDWNDFLRSSWFTATESVLYFSVETNSRKILPPYNQTPIPDDDFCIAAQKRAGDQTVTLEFVRCSNARSPGYVLCAQKPLERSIPSEEEFRMT